MRGLRTGFVVAGCVLLGFVVSAGPGLVARAAEPDRWRERLLASPPSSQQLRIAELEQRLRELEAGHGTTSPTGSASAPGERDALMAQNQELTRHNRALLLENHVLELQARAAGVCTPPDGEDPKTQLMFWADRLRSSQHGLRGGGLSAAQATALGVLLRPTRPIDRNSPWE